MPASKFTAQQKLEYLDQLDKGGVTLSELAKQLNISPQLLSSWQNNRLSIAEKADWDNRKLPTTIKRQKKVDEIEKFETRLAEIEEHDKWIREKLVELKEVGKLAFSVEGHCKVIAQWTSLNECLNNRQKEKLAIQTLLEQAKLRADAINVEVIDKEEGHKRQTQQLAEIALVELSKIRSGEEIE